MTKRREITGRSTILLLLLNFLLTMTCKSRVNPWRVWRHSSRNPFNAVSPLIFFFLILSWYSFLISCCWYWHSDDSLDDGDDHNSNVHLPGNTSCIAKQFLRCTLHQLSSNGIFQQIFAASFPGQSLISSSSWRLLLPFHLFLISFNPFTCNSFIFTFFSLHPLDKNPFFCFSVVLLQCMFL